MTKPGLRELLIRSTLEAPFLRHLREDPDAAMESFDLSEEERELLRAPDHRLLPLIGRLIRDSQAPPAAAGTLPASAEVEDPSEAPPAVIPTMLPPSLLALTVVPCLAPDRTLRYAVWVSPMAEGAVPATLPPPPGAALPGEPLAPLYSVIELDGVQTADAEGAPQVTLFAHFRQSTNALPSGSDAAAPARIESAAAAVHGATPEQRRERLYELVLALEGE